MNLIFNSDIVNLPLKTNAGRNTRSNFVILQLGVLELLLGRCWCCDAEDLV